MANNSATAEEPYMSRSELLDELALQRAMLETLDPATTDGFEEVQAAIKEEITKLRVRLKAFEHKKQQREQQNSSVVLKGPWLAAASSSSNPARKPASSSATPSSSYSMSFARPSVNKYDSSDPFADPFTTSDPRASMDPFSESSRNHTSSQRHMLSPTSTTTLPHRRMAGNMKRSIDESMGVDIKEESDNKSRRTSPGSSIPKPTVYKEDRNGFIDLCSDEEDAYQNQRKAVERFEMAKKDRELAEQLQNDLTNGGSSFSHSMSTSRPDAFSRLMGPTPSQSTPALNAPEMQTPTASTKPPYSLPGSFPTADSDSDVEFMSSNPLPQSAGRTSSLSTSYSSALERTWQDSQFGFPHRPSYSSMGGIKSEGPHQAGPSFGSNPSSSYTTQAGTQYQPTQGPYSAHNLAQANGLGGAPQPGLFSDLGMPGSSYNAPIDMAMQNTAEFSQTMRDDIYNYVTDPRKTAEDIKNLLANISPDMDIPKESRLGTPEGLKYALYEHQKVALQWLKAAETGTNKGGILADDMGLGKTLSTLALLLSRPSSNRACKTTLIVAPVALLRQWEQEIRTKINITHKMSVFIYHQGKTKSYEDMRQYDVVLTSYGTLGSEFKRLHDLQERKKMHNMDIDAPAHQRKLPFLGTRSRWYRVVLDEAQNVKNKDTKAAKAVSCLQAETRFCLTGTPMMNGVHELFSLIKFLRIRPYNEYTQFQEAFGVLKKGTGSEGNLQRALQKLQALLKAILLRRTKESKIDGEPIIKLLPKTEEQVHAIFNSDEQDFYTQLESKSKVKFNKYLKAGTVGKNYSSVLVLLLRLRQAACHPHLIMDFEEAIPPGGSADQVALAKSLAPDVVRRLAAESLWECPVCYDPLLNPLFTLDCCHHVCSECLVKIMDNVGIHEEQANAKCPSCRGDIKMSRVIDYGSFKQAHMGEKPAEADDDSDSDSSDDTDDSDDDSIDEEFEDRNDVNARGNLKGFIVDDDEVDDGFFSHEVVEKKKAKVQTKRCLPTLDDSDDDDDDDDDDLDRPAKVEAKSEVKSEVKAEKFEEGPEDDYMPDEPRVRVKPETKENDYLPDTPAEAVARGEFPIEFQRITEKVSKEADEKTARKRARKEKRKARAQKSGKGKESSKDKKPHKHLNLATLKKEAQRNAAGKRKYMRYLRANWESSAKIDKLMELLRNTAPDVKTIVFSQFTTLLDLCEIPITEAGIELGRYDGSMKTDMRHESVEVFQNRDSCRVLLVSLKAGNAGLNLVAGSQVVIMDPFWNPFVENQAVDRAHRIGQQKPVSVHRILIKGTVEDRIIALQERKRKLVDAALDEKSGNKISRLGVQELIYLFNNDGDVRETMAREPQNYMVGGGLASAVGALGSAIGAGVNAGLGALGSGAGYALAIGSGLGAAARGYDAPSAPNPYFAAVPGGGGYGGGSGGSSNPWRDAVNLMDEADDSSDAGSSPTDMGPEWLAYGGRHHY